MTLEHLLQQGNKAMRFLKDYVQGTSDEVNQLLENDYGAACYTATLFLETSTGIVVLPSLVLTDWLNPVSFGIGLYAFLDGMWRLRTLGNGELYSCGIAGSIRGLLEYGTDKQK